MTIKRSVTPFLFLLIVLVCEAARISNNITGVTDAPSNAYPWAASIRVDDSHTCAGSIIHEYFILTAARCVVTVDNNRLSARVGSVNQLAGGRIVKVETVFIHPSFGNFLHDIALLKLDKPFTFNTKINKIALASRDDSIAEGTEVFVSGWNLLQKESPSYILRHLSMSVASATECETEAGYGYEYVLCLRHPKDAGICMRDEGAGILRGQTLVAVASFYFANCGTTYPDVSTKISYYSEWIESVIKQN